MKLTSFITATLLLCSLTSCNKENTPLSETDLNATGFWINPVYTENHISYTRTSSLKENEYGLALKANLSMMERKNAGWCGTPPITYADFEGSWTQRDSIIYISVGYWGGKEKHEWKLKNIDNKNLTIEVIDYTHIPGK